jgi:NDP-sugar pyrophosphorylase family protein
VAKRSHELDRLELEIRRTQVIVPAGGQAKRFGYTDLPKALLPLDHKTLIDHQLEFLGASGLRDFLLLTGHFAEKLEAHVGSGSRFRVRVSYCRDPKGLGAVGRAKAIKNALARGAIDRRRRALIAYPDDIFFDRTLPYRLISHHLASVHSFGAVGTILLVSGHHYPFGVVREIDHSGRARDWEEKPLLDLPTYTGIGVFEPPFFDLILKEVDMRAKKAVEPEMLIFPKLTEEGRLATMTIPPEVWCSINDPKEYEAAIARVKAQEARRPGR